MVVTQVNIFFMFIYVLESLTVIAQSSFIVVVLGREWVRVKRLSPLEMILSSLGICRFCLQWASMLYNFFAFFSPSHGFWNISTAWEFTNTLTFWLTSLLAVFYFVKVSSFTHPTFLWLRWRILRLVPWLILSTLMISCVTIIPSVVRNHIQMESTTMEHLYRNRTLTERLKIFEMYFSALQKMIELGIPFLLFLASTTLLMASLIQHLKQMQQHNTSHCNSSMKAQSAALRSLVIFFIFFTSYFLAVLISYLGTMIDKRSWFWVWEVVIYAIVSIHSTLLLLSSPTSKRVLKIKCWGTDAA
ncbi:taste receptor type 2 member 16 [Castor canadensis]|uniref:taste receptor type 2 member 16 n=1 Tax=Castor canadensis TaxID=51338 RepID=UPI003D186128